MYIQHTDTYFMIFSQVSELIINAPRIGLELSGSVTSTWAKKRAIAMGYIFGVNAIYRLVSP